MTEENSLEEIIACDKNGKSFNDTSLMANKFDPTITSTIKVSSVDKILKSSPIELIPTFISKENVKVHPFPDLFFEANRNTDQVNRIHWSEKLFAHVNKHDYPAHESDDEELFNTLRDYKNQYFFEITVDKIIINPFALRSDADRFIVEKTFPVNVPVVNNRQQLRDKLIVFNYNLDTTEGLILYNFKRNNLSAVIKAVQKRDKEKDVKYGIYQPIVQGLNYLDDKDKPPNQNVNLRANRSLLRWIAVGCRSSDSSKPLSKVREWFIRNKSTKQLDLLVTGTSPRVVSISIKQDDEVFLFTNSKGEKITSPIIKLNAEEVNSIFITFRPTSTVFYTGKLIMKMEENKFKVDLCGYADGCDIRIQSPTPTAIVECQSDNRDFVVNLEPTNSGQGMLVIENRANRIGTFFIHTAEPDLTFNPRIAIMKPNSTANVYVKFNAEGKGLLNFYIVSVDEELRKAARKNALNDEVVKKEYQVFSNLELFTKLKSEQSDPSFKFGKYERTNWRSCLVRQINHNALYYQLQIMNQCRSDPLSDSASVKTVASDQSSRNYSRDEVDHRLLQQKDQKESSDVVLPVVTISNSELKFPVTPLNKFSMAGMVLHNHSTFPVNFKLMPRSVNLLSETQQCLFNGDPDASIASSTLGSSNSDSLYSLDKMPLFNSPPDTVVALEKEGSLEPLNSMMLLFRFRPRSCDVPFSCKYSIHITAKDVRDPGVIILPLSLVGTASSSPKMVVDQIPGISMQYQPPRSYNPEHQCRTTLTINHTHAPVPEHLFMRQIVLNNDQNSYWRIGTTHHMTVSDKNTQFKFHSLCQESDPKKTSAQKEMLVIVSDTQKKFTFFILPTSTL